MSRPWLRAGMVAVALTVGFAGASCTRNEANRNSETGQTAGTSGAQAPSISDQKKLVEDQLGANAAEIQLSQLAETRSSNADVKSFAKMMVRDHTKANEDLKPIAEQLGVQQPNELDSKHQKTIDRLSKLQGMDFDREFIKQMVDDHKDVADKLQPVASNAGAPNSAGGGGTTGTSGSIPSPEPGTSGSTGANRTTPPSGNRSVGASGTDTAQEVQQYASQTLPVVQEHLQRAEKLQQSIGK